MYPIKIKARLKAYSRASLIDIERGIVTNKENIVGEGSEASPLDLAYLPDDSTIIKTQNGTKITAVALLDENYEQLPQDEPTPGKIQLPNPITGTSIRDKFDEVDNELGKNAQAIDNVYIKVENDYNNLSNKINGVGGYLPSKDFGVAVPTQDDLTQWAITSLKITDPSLIPDQTRVKNTFNGNLWILNNREINGIRVFEWIDDGSDTVGVATLDTLGLVKSSGTQYKGFIEPNGEISINGLVDKLDDFNERIISNFDEINLVTGDLSDLQKIHFTEDDGQTEVKVDTLTQAIANHNERINSNFDEINFLTAEVSDFKQAQANTTNDINSKIEGINGSIDQLNTNVGNLSRIVISNFDEINHNIGDISDLQQTAVSTEVRLSSIIDSLKEHKERILDNFDNVNNAIGDISNLENTTRDISTKLNGLLDSNGLILSDKLPFNISDYVDLTSTQLISGLKVFNNFNLQVPGNKPIQMQAVEGSNLLIKQSNNTLGSSIAIQTSDASGDQILTLSGIKASENSRLDLSPSGFNFEVSHTLPDATEENTSIVINSAVSVESKEFLYNGTQIATLDDIPVLTGNLVDAAGMMVAFDIDNTKLKDNVQDIFKHLNIQNGGSLVNVSIKTSTENITGDVLSITETNGLAPSISTEYGQPILAANSFYYLTPEQISANGNNYVIQFGCKTNYPYGKGVLILTATKNPTTGLFENMSAKLSGEAFYKYNENLFRYYFQDVDISDISLAHLTVRYIQFAE